MSIVNGNIPQRNYFTAFTPVSQPVQDSSSNNNEQQTKLLFDEFHHFVKYRTNNDNDIFLKDYLLNSLEKQGFKKPDNLQMYVASPLTINPQIKEDIEQLIFKEFKGFINNFFDLFTDTDDTLFKEKLDKLELDPIKKYKLTKIKNYMDDYYKVTIKLPNSKKFYNLNNLTQEDKIDILKLTDPEQKEYLYKVFSKLDDLKTLSKKFSRSEIERHTTSESGENAKGFIQKLFTGIVGLSVLESISHPLADLFKNNSTAHNFTLNSTKYASSITGDTLAGYNDSLQNEVTLGKEKAKKIFWGSTIFGIATSILGSGLSLSGKNKVRNAILFTNAAAGASIFSNAMTMSNLYNDFDKMQAKGLIDYPKPNMSKLEKSMFKLKTAWKNYASFDAYFGKFIGLLICTPIAILTIKSGLYVGNKGKSFSDIIRNATALMFLTSSESLAGIGMQLVGDNKRQSKIKSAQNVFAKGEIDPNNYNPRNYCINLKKT